MDPCRYGGPFGDLQQCALRAWRMPTDRLRAWLRCGPCAPPCGPRCQLAGVADIEARYRRVVEQNRELYNEVQDLKGSIRVFCRIRWACRAVQGLLGACCGRGSRRGAMRCKA